LLFDIIGYDTIIELDDFFFFIFLILEAFRTIFPHLLHKFITGLKKKILNIQ